ncbi:MAG: thermonuclease family protein [Actinobacteria bacterium]|nr:thermonuclease family protein [Actinomycetota bacterium]
MKNKTSIFIIFIIFFISVLFFQTSCGLFYPENTEILSKNDNTGDSSVLTNDYKNLPDSSKILNSDSIDDNAENAPDISGIYENSNFDDDSYKVVKVIDGDTIDLKNGKRLRLIGINTPETGMYFYEEAREFMEILVLNKQVKLEKDVTDRDQYGRFLRYVYCPQYFVNLEMIRCGFANAYTYPPDVKHTDKFLKAERYARENEAGLWQKSPDEFIEIKLNYDAEGSDSKNLNGEWFSIKNTGGKVLNMDGWTVKDAGTNIYKFTVFNLGSQKTVFIYSGSGNNSSEKLYWNCQQPVWNNEHDTLYLRDKDGLLVSIYNY